MFGTLVLYGNNCISNFNLQTGQADTQRGAAGVDVQFQPIARGRGSAIVNTKQESKNISLSGKVYQHTAPNQNIDKLYTKLNYVFKRQDAFLRLSPEWLAIDDLKGASVSNFTVGNDGGGVSISGEGYQLDSAQSLKFDIYVAKSGSNNATISRTLSTPINMTGKGARNLTPFSSVYNASAWSRGPNMTDGGAASGLFGAPGRKFTSASAGLSWLRQNITGIVAGQTYTLSTYARSGGTPTYFVYIDWYNAGGGLISSSFMTPTTLTATHQRYSITATAPAGAVRALINPVPTDAAGGSEFIITATQFELGTSPTDYQDNPTGANFKGNLEFWLDIPDVKFITSVDLRVGNDSSNYLSRTFTKNYEGELITNGANFFSVPVDQMTQTGTIDNLAIDYYYIQINYTSSAEDILNCYFPGIIWTNEDRNMNYRCYRQGEVSISNKRFDVVSADWSASFINYTGYAESTHETTLFTQNFTDNEDTQKIYLDGSYDPLPVIQVDVTSATNLSTLKLTNLDNNNTLEITPDSAVIAAKDVLVVDYLNQSLTLTAKPVDFKGYLPDFQLGQNRVKLEAISVNQSYIACVDENPTGAMIWYVYYKQGGVVGRRIAQSFVAGNTGRVFKINLKMIGNKTVRCSVYNNNAGIPGSTLIADGTISPASSWPGAWTKADIPSFSVTLGTTYWIVLEDTDFTNNGDPSGVSPVSVKFNSFGTVGSARAMDETVPGTWINSFNTTADWLFEVFNDEIPTTNITWTIKAKKLYS